jgi:hypothetical protein
MTTQAEIDWEHHWAPYDDPTYQGALAFVRPDDIVLDIGAGDLRFARQMARRARHVYALERNADLLVERAAAPSNLTIIYGDARFQPFPPDVTLGALLMRHCRHFALYYDKLAAVGCRRLITNARWRTGVELIHLDQPLRSFSSIKLGWYACRCGAAGFVPGPPDELSPAILNNISQVSTCPTCGKPHSPGGSQLI